MSKEVNTYPTYEDIDRGCGIIVQQILSKDLPHPLPLPRVVVGLTRGGLIPAVIISHMLGAIDPKVKMVPVSYSSKKGEGEYKLYENELPPLPDMNILIVDDIADSGHTLWEVMKYYQDLDYITRSATLHYKESSVIKPTYFWRTIPTTSPWIIYPWEIE